MSQSEKIAGLQHQLKGLEKSVELMEAARKLCSNKEFKKLILEHYFESEAARYVHLLASLNINKEDILKNLETISLFRNWFLLQCSGLERARAEISEIKDKLAFLAAYDDEEDV